MAKLTLSEAARACGVARTTLQRAIPTGRLALDAEHRVEISALLRTGYQVDAAQQELLLLRRENERLQQERAQLVQQVEMLRTLHHTTQQYLTQAQQMLHEAQQRYDRLLEAPRPTTPAAAPRPSPPLAIPGYSAPQALPDPWQQILTYMQMHPGPQRPQDVQRALGRREPVAAHHAPHGRTRVTPAGCARGVRVGRIRPGGRMEIAGCRATVASP